MTHIVVMPRLGLTMEEGSVVSWKKQQGDLVAKGEVLFTVETDKTELEVESADSGYLSAILVQPGAKVPVGATLATLSDRPGDRDAGTSSLEHGAPSASVTAGPVAELQCGDRTIIPGGAPPFLEVAFPGKVAASPRARRLAEELGIDIGAVLPVRGQRIVEDDVRSFQAHRDAPSPPGKS